MAGNPLKFAYSLYRSNIGDPVFKQLAGGLAYTIGARPIGPDKFRLPSVDFKIGRMLEGGFKATGPVAKGAPNTPSIAEMGLNVGLMGLAVFSGLAEGGLVGGAKMLALDAAVMGSLLRRAHYPGGQFQTKSALGLGGMAARGLGGYVGAATGAAVFGSMVPVLGTGVGMMAGASFGTAPLGFMKRHPILSLGAVATAAAYGGAKMVAHGTYEVLRMGYYSRRSQIGIDTAGDLSAFMTQSAHSQRQRAVMAIQKSHLNARSALGHEASFLHYPQRGYHSQYRTL